jgi:two-component system chemotaxis response regulator CheY
MLAADHNILVVEDDSSLRDAMGDLLGEEGMSATRAENGQVGLDLLRAGARPCLVLLDLQMPLVDGMTFRRRQLEDPRIAGIPVVVMTGQPGKAQEAKRLGVALTMSKPIAPSRVVGVVERFCAHAKAS